MTKTWASSIRRRLAVSAIPLDAGPGELRRQILQDPYLLHHYKAIYARLLALVPDGPGPILEIGSGPGVVDLLNTEVFRTDIQCTNIHDFWADAQHLPLTSQSCRALLLKDALHHIPDVELFFHEADRVLVNGGRVIVMDPYWKGLARIVYRMLHPEPFDVRTPTWSFSNTSRLSSNQALLYLLLRRDRELFSELFPRLNIIEVGPCIGPSFLLSGGLYGRSKIPSSILLTLWEWEERRGRLLNSLRFGFIVVFEKK